MLALLAVFPLSALANPPVRVQDEDLGQGPAPSCEIQYSSDPRDGTQYVSAWSTDAAHFEERIWYMYNTGDSSSRWIENERLVAGAGRAEIERTLLDDGAPVERRHVPLIALGTTGAYAYRSEDRIFVIMEGGDGWVRPDSSIQGLSSGTRLLRDIHRGCYAVTELQVDHGQSETVQIRVGDKLLTASVSQSSRDPEPLLSVIVTPRRPAADILPSR